MPAREDWEGQKGWLIEMKNAVTLYSNSKGECELAKPESKYSGSEHQSSDCRHCAFLFIAYLCGASSSSETRESRDDPLL